jgi:hypothetical protein
MPGQFIWFMMNSFADMRCYAAPQHQLAQTSSTYVVVARTSGGADAPSKLWCLPLHLAGHLPQSSGHPDTLAGRALQT